MTKRDLRKIKTVISKKVVEDAGVANEIGEKRCKVLRILVKGLRATRLSSQWET